MAENFDSLGGVILFGNLVKYKINRAADDVAGLAISEKMRRQIRGLTQATANAQDGISCVQTAEGALNEVHDMLQRMNELAIKAGNETLQTIDLTFFLPSGKKNVMMNVKRPNRRKSKEKTQN